MIDWGAIETDAIASAVVAFVGMFIVNAFLRLLFYEFMSNPGVQSMIRLANKFSGGKAGEGVGGWIAGKVGGFVNELVSGKSKP